MNKIVCEFEDIHGRTCTKWNKREFELELLKRRKVRKPWKDINAYVFEGDNTLSEGENDSTLPKTLL